MKCIKCGVIFDRLNQGEFEDMGLGNICNECINKREEEVKNEKPMKFEETYCNQCGEYFDPDDLAFYDEEDNGNNICQECFEKSEEEDDEDE